MKFTPLGFGFLCLAAEAYAIVVVENHRKAIHLVSDPWRIQRWGQPWTQTAKWQQQQSSIVMRDYSCSYWFQVGDTVQVSASVKKAGIDLKGRIGRVIETWEKCDVDPTCCCAEFVDENFAVTVEFKGELDPDRTTATMNSLILGIDENFTHYFNEDELVKTEISII